MLHKVVRLAAFYNRKELKFSHFEQFLAQVFAGFLALTAAVLWKPLLSVDPALYAVAMVLFASWPIAVKIRQAASGRYRVFSVREQKLTQLSAASLFLGVVTAVPALQNLSFPLIVALTVAFALRPVYLLYIHKETWLVRSVGAGLVVTYVALAVTLHHVGLG